MFGAPKKDHWMLTPDESRQFVSWLKSLFGIKTDKEKSIATEDIAKKEVSTQ